MANKNGQYCYTILSKQSKNKKLS